MAELIGKRLTLLLALSGFMFSCRFSLRKHIKNQQKRVLVSLGLIKKGLPTRS